MSVAETQSPYRWVIVAIGAVMTCVAIGAMFSLAVFLQPMSDDTGWTRAGISTAMTLNFLVMGAAGFGWGLFSDRYGARPAVLAGSVLLGLSESVVSFYVGAEWSLTVAFFVLIGILLLRPRGLLG